MATSATPDCPGHDVWQRWLGESLPEPARRHCDDHVESCPHCRTLLDRLTEEPGWFWLSDVAGPQPAQPAKPSIPGLEVLEEVGRGGHGVVFRAVQTTIGRVVALKTLRHGPAASAGERERLLGESTALARLRHPNIVQVYDSGEADGLPYLVMEWMDGGSLADHLRGTPLPPAQAAAVVETLAGAVDAAHRAGIVHRDLKPANVLLGKAAPAAPDAAPLPGIAELKVSDFGLARPLDLPGVRTPTVAILGTPSYMAPEQADGESRTAGPAADVYALGAIFYELLTGRPPFAAESPFETLVQVRTLDPVPPRKLAPRMPRDLETICLHCLHKRPARRYASAAELAEDLRRALAGQPINARPVGPLERAWKWTRRNRLATVLAAATLTVAAVIAIGTVEARRRAAIARGEGLVNGLLAADPRDVPLLMQQIDRYRAQVNDYLTQRAAAAEPRSRADLNARVALLRGDSSQVPSLVARIPGATPDELLLIRAALLPHAADVAVALWAQVQADDNETAVRCRAACALAGLAPGDDRWAGIAAPVAQWLAAENPLLVGRWCEALRPVGGRLVETLGQIVRDPGRTDGERETAASAIADFAADRPEILVATLLRAEPRAYLALLPAVRRLPAARPLLDAAIAEAPPARTVTERDRDEQAKRHVRAAIALLHGGDSTTIDGLFQLTGTDVRRRYYAIHLLAPLGVDPGHVAARLKSATEAVARRSLLLALGEYPVRQFGPRRQDDLREFLTRLFRDDPDPGVHSAVEWLVRRAWSRSEWLTGVERELAGKEPGDRRWLVTPGGVTMSVVEGPVEFQFGAKEDEPHREGEPLSRHVIQHRFALATREVTVAEFARFLKAYPKAIYQPPNPDDRQPLFPVRRPFWPVAVQYCRWLCEAEGVPEAEMPYPPVDQIAVNQSEVPTRVTFPARFLTRTGYRLPTEEEWEYAVRAGTETPRFFGYDFDLLYKYGWCLANGGDSCHEAGLLRPSDLGLFDIYGNVWEWTQPAFYRATPSRPGLLSIVHFDRPWAPEFGIESDRQSGLFARGGSYLYHAPFVRSAKRYGLWQLGDTTVGFRIARTLPDRPAK